MKHLIDITLLKNNRDFALLYTGQFVSFIGAMITSVVLPYQIYSISKSTLMVGLLSLAQLLPLLITALLGGVLADRYNRRKLVMISESLLMLGCIALIINAYQSNPSIAIIFVVASIMSAITGLHRPAFDSMTQQLVSPENYKALGALSGFKFGFCMIVGPAIAGILIAAYGIFLTYIVDCLTFIISLITLCLIKHRQKPHLIEHPSIMSSLNQGIQFALKRQELMGSYCVDFFAMIFAMPTALFPAMAVAFGGVKTLGLLYAAPAVGSLFISLFSGWTANVKRDGKAIAIAAALWGISMIGFGLSSALGPALIFLALAGAFDAVSGIFRSTLWNHTIPHDFRGRLAGIEMLSYLSGPKLGDTRAGVIASYVGITTAIVSGGILCVVGVAACCLLMPKFWKYRSE